MPRAKPDPSRFQRSREVPQLISLRELSERFSCDRTTVARRLAAAGVRPYVFNDSRTGLKRYALADVLNFLNDARGPSTPTLGSLDDVPPWEDLP